MIAIRWRLPFRAPAREEKARTGRMQVVDAAHQARHIAGLKDQPVKASVGLFPGLHVGCMIACARCFLCLIKDFPCQVWRCIPKGHGLQCGPHARHFANLSGAEARNAYSAAWLADRETLRLKPTKGLAHRNMAGPEFGSDMILTQFLTGCDGARDNAIRKSATNPVGQGFFDTACHKV